MSRRSISIVIPTRDRKDSLKAALDSIAMSDYPKDCYEVIVVDDGSVDGTDEFVREFQSHTSTVLHYYKQERKGLSAAKNLGVTYAKGDLLAFTDDDCLLEKDWLSKLANAFNAPEVGAVGGPDRAPPISNVLTKCIDYAVTSFIGTGGVREGRMMRLAKYFPRGCNTALVKSAVSKVGGFDETLKTGEDIELLYRVKKGGYSIRYAADAFVWHKRRDSIQSFLGQIFSRGYWRAELGYRHRELLEISYFLPSLMIIGFIALSGVSFIFPSCLRGLTLLVSLYLLIVLLGGIAGAMRMKDPRASLLIPFLIILQHLAYGSGFIVGLIHRKAHV